MAVRVLVADKLPEDLFSGLSGVHADLQPELTAESVANEIVGAKVLVVRSTVVTRAAIEAANVLALIVRAGSGVNNIDVEAASERGVYVTNCPGKNAVAVAELTLGLILAMDRKIPDNVVDLRQGLWNKADYAKSEGLKGKRLGLVGFGNIAREVAVRAQAFGMDVMAYSRKLTNTDAQAAHVERAPSLQAIFSQSDIVSLHVPASPETKQMIDAGLLSQMKSQAMLINTARHNIIDHAALIEALHAGAIRYGTDVYPQEPEGKKGTITDPLASLANVYGTHHIGASTAQAQREIAKATAEIVEAFVDRGEVRNAVNLLRTPPIQGTLVVRHLDKVGVLAGVLTALREANINVEGMDNVVFQGQKAACAHIEVSAKPDESVMTNLKGQDGIIGVELIER